MKRVYAQAILDHFSTNRQMLFIMGPRQVGKTTTCTTLAKKYKLFFYFTWDNYDDRDLIIDGPEAIAEAIGLAELTDSTPLVIFDEVHKYPDWKIFLKGLYDSFPHQLHILVTGSARLDVYKRGGDSLMGRYFMYRFHPITIAEILNSKIREEDILDKPTKIRPIDFEALWKYGGYPDPYIKRNTRFFNRWKNLRFQQLFQEDIRDLTRIQEIAQLEVLARILKNQVGQQTSCTSLAKSVKVSNVTINRWLKTLHSLYYSFEVRPYAKNIARSLIKEPKYYLWDWSEIADIGAKSENFIASHLLKAVQFWTDFGLGSYELYYLRDKDQREVDFLVVKDEKPWFLVEVKYKNSHGISPALKYYQKATKAKHAFQVVIDLPYVNKNCFLETTPTIVPAQTFLSQLI
jgi:uncharacterized protein